MSSECVFPAPTYAACASAYDITDYVVVGPGGATVGYSDAIEATLDLTSAPVWCVSATYPTTVVNGATGDRSGSVTGFILDEDHSVVVEQVLAVAVDGSAEVSATPVITGRLDRGKYRFVTGVTGANLSIRDPGATGPTGPFYARVNVIASPVYQTL
jgi:hypothetical protein